MTSTYLCIHIFWESILLYVCLFGDAGTPADVIAWPLGTKRGWKQMSKQNVFLAVEHLEIKDKKRWKRNATLALIPYIWSFKYLKEIHKNTSWFKT